MRVLLINQFFWPDCAPTGQFLEDLARHMAQQGHTVTVICGTAGYATASHTESPPSVTILRVSGTPFSRSITGRTVSYICFLAGALWLSIKTTRADLVVTLTTPPLLSIVGTLLKGLRRSRHFIWEMDVFPDALISLGAVKEHSAIAWLLGKIADYSRNRSDGVIALGPCMRDRLLRRGIRADRLHIVENWANREHIRPTPYHETCRLRVVYSGNLGLPHDVETIASAMEQLRDDQRFHFSFAGGGAGKSELEAFCRKRHLSNVAFLPYRRRDEVGDTLASGDIGLVTMKEDWAGAVVPSKVYGVMAAQRPILFIGPCSATPALLIKRYGCGWRIDCGDVQGLIRLLKRLFHNRNLIQDAGMRAREAFLTNYELKHGVTKISAIVNLPLKSCYQAPAQAGSQSAFERD